jgi:hypothetical protein
MGTVFLSHSSVDKRFVRQLALDLLQRGYAVWFDEWGQQSSGGIDIARSI